MIKIKKMEPPEALLELQSDAIEKGLSPDEAYNSLQNPLKSFVLNQLMIEQGHLCAYCMRRIPDEREVDENIPRVTIEHWLARNPKTAEDARQGLDYNNFLAVCSGNRGKRGTRKKRDLTCDAKCGNSALTVNPVREETLASLKYSEDGRITSDDDTIDKELTQLLNLNCMSDNVLLPDARKAVLDSIQQDIPADCSEEELKNYCKDLLASFESETDPKTPYIGIGLWWLRDTLRSMQKHETEASET